MASEKSIVRISSTSLDKISNQMTLVNKILSENKVKRIPAKRTPDVVLDLRGIIEIKGRSIPENAKSYFEPIIKWIEEYIQNPAEITYIHISLEYINGASKKYIFSLLHKISYVGLRNKKVIINWYYRDDNDPILKTGEDFTSILDLPFNFIKLN